MILLNNPFAKFVGLFTAFVLILTVVIYFRESDLIAEISFLQVLFWQLAIWSPWIVYYLLFSRYISLITRHTNKKVIFLSSGLVWNGLHFMWFFFISSNFSPYLGKPATGYGVYPYFFIFWTMIDMVFLWNFYLLIIRYKEDSQNSNTKEINTIGLSRGKEKVVCEIKDIHWLSADNYYTHLQTSYGRFTMRNTLKYYYQKLEPHGFIQIHRSTVINTQFIQGLKKRNNSLFVIMQDGSEKAVSRQNTSVVREQFSALTN